MNLRLSENAFADHPPPPQKDQRYPDNVQQKWQTNRDTLTTEYVSAWETERGSCPYRVYNFFPSLCQPTKLHGKKE